MSIHEHLLEWVRSFGLKKEPSTLSELSNGLAIVEILGELVPSYIDASKFDDKDALASKTRNIDQIMTVMELVFSQDLQSSVNLRKHVNTDDVADGQEEAVSRLLRFLLLLAVKCEASEEVIRNIMELDEETQGCLMHVIQEGIPDESESDEGADVDNFAGDDDAAVLQTRLDELQTRYELLLSQKQQLEEMCRTTKEKWQADVKELERVRDSQEEAQTALNRAQAMLKTRSMHESDDMGKHQQMMENLQREVNRCKMELKSRDSELAMLKQQVADTEAELNEAQVTVEVYERNKKKIDEYNIMKKRCAELEMEAQDADVIKEQNIELTIKNTSMISEIDKLKSEVLELEGKVNSAMAMKDQLRQEKEQVAPTRVAKKGPSDDDDGEAESLSPVAAGDDPQAKLASLEKTVAAFRAREQQAHLALQTMQQQREQEIAAYEAKLRQAAAGGANENDRAVIEQLRQENLVLRQAVSGGSASGAAGSVAPGMGPEAIAQLQSIAVGLQQQSGTNTQQFQELFAKLQDLPAMLQQQQQGNPTQVAKLEETIEALKTKLVSKEELLKKAKSFIEQQASANALLKQQNAHLSKENEKLSSESSHLPSAEQSWSADASQQIMTAWFYEMAFKYLREARGGGSRQVSAASFLNNFRQHNVMGSPRSR